MQKEINHSANSKIVNGEFAIVQKIGGEHIKLCRLNKGQRITIEKLNFDPKDAIGQSFGMFEVSDRGKILKPIVASKSNSATSLNATQSNETITLENGNIDQVNSSLVNANQAEIPRQKLTQEEIAELKIQGIGTSNLVDKLVEGNSAFQDRTVYSKQKYVRKKTQKHSDRILISRPTIRLMCQSYYRKDSEKISHLRIDLLGILLQHSGVHSGNCNVFVYEQTMGLVGAAFLERLAGFGNCIFLHKGEWPQSIPCIDAMNFNEKQKATFLPLRINTFAQGKVIIENGQEEETTEPSAPKKLRIDPSSANLQKKSEKLRKETKAIDLIFPEENELNRGNGHLDAICLAGRNINSLAILRRVFPGLRLSGSLVVYSPYREHLLPIWKWLRSTGSAIDIQISQHFYRALQVLPQRTHPLMQQLVTGGFVLHAIKVAPPQNEQLNQRETMRALLDSMTNNNNNKAKETNPNPKKTIE